MLNPVPFTIELTSMVAEVLPFPLNRTSPIQIDIKFSSYIEESPVTHANELATASVLAEIYPSLMNQYQLQHLLKYNKPHSHELLSTSTGLLDELLPTLLDK
jgi:hypothetical protein